MLTEEQIEKIKEHLEKSQNPIFFFDNDADGLCSFLILRRWIGRGRGVPVRSYPGLTKELFKKVRELNADYIFILDKPVVDRDFFEEANKNNIPVVWVDHHEIDRSVIPHFVDYYNPLYNEGRNNEPATFLCYQISKRKEDLWLYIVGCISDGFIPKEYDDFQKKYPELSLVSKNAFDILYKSKIGEVTRILGFALKDKTTSVINMIKFLMKVKEPTEILEESSKNNYIHKRFKYVEGKLKRLLKKALSGVKKSDKIIFFQYSGSMSISADLANELIYRFPDKIVVVVYVSGMKANISGRGEKIKEYILESIKNLEGSRGGGHENAVGAQIRVDDIKKFKENLKNRIK